MSKSLGNVIDPLDVTKGASLEHLLSTLSSNTNMSVEEKDQSRKDLTLQYPHGIPECGVDGLRFALCSYLEGGDMSGTINLDVQRAVSARHMCNKLWNASKFILASSSNTTATCSVSPIGSSVPPSNTGQHRLMDRWMLSRVATTVRSVNANMDEYRLGNVTSVLRNHLIQDLCDVYIELAKNDVGNPIVQETLHSVLLTYLKLLHPIMPYVTEEIYQAIVAAPVHNKGEPGEQNELGELGEPGSVHSIMSAAYPVFEGEWDEWWDESVETEFNTIIMEPAKAIRSLKKLAADTFGKEMTQEMYVHLLVVDEGGEKATGSSGSLLSTLQSNVGHVRQLCRHQAVELVDAEQGSEHDSGLPCLARTLVLPDGASVVVRVYVPKMKQEDMEHAHSRIAQELKRISNRQKKTLKQMEKLLTLTARATYVETAPAHVQEGHTMKINMNSEQMWRTWTK